MAAAWHRLHVLEQAGTVHPGERVEQRRTCEFYEGVSVEVAQRKFLAGTKATAMW
jgi:hypothetical protein